MLQLPEKARGKRRHLTGKTGAFAWPEQQLHEQSRMFPRQLDWLFRASPTLFFEP
jgi:hypothetical protein